MLRSLYDWTMALSARKSAAVWLAVIAFVESSVFLVPADVLFLPMALSQARARLALCADCHRSSPCSAALPAGASVISPSTHWPNRFLQFWGKLDTFNELKAGITDETVALLLVTSGFAHLPPIKVVTILSGVAKINLGFFVVSAIITRGARFFLLAWLLRRYGEDIRHFIEKRLGQITMIGAAVLIVAYIAYKFLTH